VPYSKALAQVRYRIRKDLLRKLEKAAKQNGRSVNEEVESRLDDSFNFSNWREEQERWKTEFEKWREEQERWRLALDTMLKMPLLTAEEVTEMRDRLEEDNDRYLIGDPDVRDVKRIEE
jgi:hypothetical protein